MTRDDCVRDQQSRSLAGDDYSSGHESETSIRLEHTVVGYDGSPDRCTVYPPGTDDVERMSTWLSADWSVFVSLWEFR